MSRRIALSLCAALALSCADTRAHYELKLPDLRATLPNGLRVIVLPDDTTQLVAVAVRYEVGSNEDPKGKEGLAHLVEHLMFQLRPNGPDQAPIMAALRQLTVFVNARTEWDLTQYDALATRDNLESLLALEAARMYLGCDMPNEDGTSTRIISQETFDREREVVRNEIRTRLGSPEGQVFYQLLKEIYPAGHPYSRMPGGDDASISSATLDDACQFMKDYYTPDRAILVIAGNTTEAEVRELVAKYFGDLPRRTPKPRAEVPAIQLKKRQIVHEADVDETTVSVVWAMPRSYTADDIPAQFAAGSVAGITSGEGDRWEFATGVGAQGLGGALAPTFMVQVRLRDPGKVGDALDAVWRATRQARRGWETDSQSLEDLRARLIADRVYAFESLNARTEEFARYAQYDTTGAYFGGELKLLKELQLGRAKSFAKSALSADKAVVIVVKPREGAELGKTKRQAAAYTGGDQHVRDELEVDPEEARMQYSVPKGGVLAGATRFTMGNGMRVILLPSASSLPVMTVKLVFNAGSAHESADRAGMAELAGRFLRPTAAGAGVGGAIESADALGKVGADRFVEVDEDATVFTVRGLSVYEEVLIKGLERLIKIGEYDQEAVENRRKYYGFLLKRAEVRQQIAFEREVQKAVFGEEHPYTRTGFPTLETLGRFGRDALMEYKATHFSAKNATLIVAGKFDPKSAEKTIRGNFGDWGGGRLDEPVTAAAPARTGAIFTAVAGEDRPIMEARIAFPAPAGIDGQYGARLVLAEMMNLRMATVREDLGSSYGVYARLETHVGPGAYMISGPIDIERGGESLKAMRAGIESLRAGERFDEDFVRARREVLKRLLTRSSSSTDLARQLETLARYGLDEKFRDKLVKQIAKLSPEQVKQLVADDLRADREVIVVLGHRPGLERAFAELGIKPTWVEPK
jgi:zinc protease